MATEEELHEALLNVYERARGDAGITFRQFRAMLNRQTARETAEQLLRPMPNGRTPNGFRRIVAAGRPDLTLEYVVLQQRFRNLFTDGQRAEARRRLGLVGIIEEVNERAADRPIGTLQEWRRERDGRKQSRPLFPWRPRKEDRDWIFHIGGLPELQFNMGFEAQGGGMFRHGVAFSLQPTRPPLRRDQIVDVMLPKIGRFNEFMRTYPEAFADLSMWHFTPEVRSENYAPGPIPAARIEPDNFIMLGALQPAEDVDVDWILDDFDRLLTLYQYVESKTKEFPRFTRTRKGFVFTPGNKARAPRTKYTRNEFEVDKELRHNVLQAALFTHLEKLHGADNVSGEQDCGNGTPIDVCMTNGKDYVYYELKTASTPQGCIRQAIGQLMEYSYWPGAHEANALVIVGEHKSDKNSKAYLDMLNRRFKLPISYRQFDVKSGRLV